MKGTQKMKVGPSIGTEQTDLSNYFSAAVIKSYGSEQLKKRL